MHVQTVSKQWLTLLGRTLWPVAGVEQICERVHVRGGAEFFIRLNPKPDTLE